jgi:hypothetical protein
MRAGERLARKRQPCHHLLMSFMDLDFLTFPVVRRRDHFRELIGEQMVETMANASLLLTPSASTLSNRSFFSLSG